MRLVTLDVLEIAALFHESNTTVWTIGNSLHGLGSADEQSLSRLTSASFWR